MYVLVHNKKWCTQEVVYIINVDSFIILLDMYPGTVCSVSGSVLASTCSDIENDQVIRKGGTAAVPEDANENFLGRCDCSGKRKQGRSKTLVRPSIAINPRNDQAKRKMPMWEHKEVQKVLLTKETFGSIASTFAPNSRRKKFGRSSLLAQLR